MAQAMLRSLATPITSPILSAKVGMRRGGGKGGEGLFRDQYYIISWQLQQFRANDGGFQCYIFPLRSGPSRHSEPGEDTVLPDRRLQRLWRRLPG